MAARKGVSSYYPQGGCLSLRRLLGWSGNSRAEEPTRVGSVATVPGTGLPELQPAPGRHLRDAGLGRSSLPRASSSSEPREALQQLPVASALGPQLHPLLAEKGRVGRDTAVPLHPPCTPWSPVVPVLVQQEAFLCPPARGSLGHGSGLRPAPHEAQDRQCPRTTPNQAGAASGRCSWWCTSPLRHGVP